MSGCQERDDQPPILDGLDGSIARTDPEFPAYIPLDHELEAFTHGRHALSMTKALFVCQRWPSTCCPRMERLSTSSCRADA